MDARRLLASGVDPGENRKTTKTANADRATINFEVIAREWYAKQVDDWAPNHATRVLRLFERDLFPLLGKKSIASLTAPELLAVLRKIESRQAVDTAHRARAYCGQVFRYAIATGRAAKQAQKERKMSHGQLQGLADPSTARRPF